MILCMISLFFFYFKSTVRSSGFYCSVCKTDSFHTFSKLVCFLQEFIPDMAKQYGFQYELVQYKWPRWLHQQTEKQRIIWGYKILFLDVLFPLAVDKILFVDADQVKLRRSCANIHPASVQIFNTLFTTMKV